MSKRMVLHVCLLGLVMMTCVGCQTAPEADPALTGTPAAIGELRQCTVCRCSGDLACLSVKVEADTPTFVYDGKTYYFCSDGCMDDFKKEPAKYLSKK